METIEAAAADLARRVARARRPCALTGAGVSEESGIPTFRGPGGYWRDRRPEDLATPEAFRRDPREVWEWYDWRRGLVARARPNAAHLALAALSAARLEFALVTQNVDGLHRRAGSRRVLELHGSLWRVRCTACGRETEDERVPLPIPPSCSECGGLLRPAVVWFGERLSAGVFGEAWEAVKSCDLLLSIGTSGVVEPAASLVRLAAERGAPIVEINPRPSALAALAERVYLYKAGELLGRLGWAG